MSTPPKPPAGSPTPGSLADLLEKKQTLEGDITSLTHLRDQLALALVTMEQNTDRITAWLKQNREPIIVARHRLTRALTQKPRNAAKAKEIITKQISAEILAFLLTDDSVHAQAKAAFGDKGDIVTLLEQHVRGLPAQLIEALPAMELSDDASKSISQMQSALATDTPATDAQPQAKAQEPKGGILSGWFKSQSQREAEEAQSSYEGMLTYWRQIQRDLIGLQSDRHYYIDSFMDWVGENLSPSTPEQNFAAIMTQYRHPAYVIARAQDDYNQALKERTKHLLEDAKTYSRLAQLLDDQNINGFIAELPALFPRPDQPEAAEMRRLLLADFDASSLGEIALNHVKNPQDRHALLKAGIAFEGHIKIKGSAQAPTLYSAIFAGVTANPATLPLETLSLMIKHVDQSYSGFNSRSYMLEKDILKKLTERFGDDDTVYTNALCALLSPYNKNTSHIDTFLALRRATIDKNSERIAAVFAALPSANMASDVRALWDLIMRGASNTGISLTNEIRAASKNTTTLVSLLTQALKLGIANEMVVKTAGDMDAANTALDLIDELLDSKNIAAVTPAQITLLLAGANLATHQATRDFWHDKVSSSVGLIAQVAVNDALTQDKKLAMIAALLSPLSSRYETTAILEGVAISMASRNSGKAEHIGLLRDAARGMIGDVIEINSSMFLSNPERIANIWFDAQGDGMGSVFFTLGEKTQLLSARMSAKDAGYLFDILHSRYAFNRENGGLYNPALADGFSYNDTATRIIFDLHEAPLNIPTNDRRMLKTLPDMVHAHVANAKDGGYISMRPRAVLALIPMTTPDHWLMIDRNGNHQIVEKLNMPQDEAPLLRMGNAYINPAAASLLSIDGDNQSLSLRVENHIFTQLVEAMERQDGLASFSNKGQYLCVTASNKAQWQACMDAIEKDPSQLSPGGDLDHLRFNIGVLGFIAPYADGKSAGILYSHRDKGGVNGRIDVGADILPELINGLRKTASTRSNILLMPHNGNILSELMVDTKHLHNVFYSSKEAALMMLTEHSNLSPGINPSAAIDMISNLAKKNAGWTGIDNRTTPLDIARMDRATLLYWDNDDNSANTLIGNRVVNMGMTRQDFDRFVESKLLATQPPAATLDTKAMADFAKTCAAPVTAGKELPAPRKNDSARDLLAKITDSGSNGQTTEYIKESYRDIMKQKESSNSYKKSSNRYKF